MKKALPLLIILIFGFLQSTVLNLNLLLIFVLLMGGYGWAFLSGLVLDLLAPQTLGLSSLLFLLILFLFRLYSRKYEPHPLFLSAFVFLASFAFAKMTAGFWQPLQGLLLALLILPFRERFKRERQLKLEL